MKLKDESYRYHEAEAEYNSCVNRYNGQIEKVPDKYVAGILGLKKQKITMKRCLNEKHCVRYGYVISLILLVFMTIFFSVRSYHLGKYEGAFSQAEVTVLNDVWTKTPDVSESGDKDSYLVYSYTTKMKSLVTRFLLSKVIG